MSATTSTLELHLDALAFGGEAVGRDDGGRVVFVAGGAPGDRVEVRIVEEKRRFARGELVRVIEPGPARVVPPCALADRCGGCPWQHITVEAQRAAKEQILRRALDGLAQVEPLEPAPASLGYRARARMTARAAAGDGDWALGFQARRSHKIVDVEHCPALDGALDRALQAARRALGNARPLGDGGTLAGLVGADGRVHLALTGGARAASAQLRAAAQRLVGGDGIVGVSVDGAELGAPGVDDGDGLFGSASGFAQANRAQNERLRARVRAAVPDGARVLELFAGDGNFTRDLVARAAGGVAVEGNGPAAARLRATIAGRAGARGWTVVAEPVERVVRRFAAAGERFDLVLLDPPRVGAADVMADLPSLGPARVVYVSCDPMTLARDLGRLAYARATATPIDMMPHTSHVEIVCVVDGVTARSRSA